MKKLEVVKAKGLLAAIILICLTGCGYRFGQGTIASEYSSISVPYVSGDRDGSLTAAVIKQLNVSSPFRYQDSCGDLTLKICLIDYDDENIGFRYDRHKDGRLTHSVIPTETRITAIAEIKVMETSTGRVVMEPVRLTASVEFDHDYYSSRDGVNIFSLGQLIDFDEAYDAVMTPLNRALAQKIVDYLCNSW